MTKKRKVDLNVAYRLLNPGCVVLVSVGDGERDNLFTVTWNMPVENDPPMVGLVSWKKHFSYPFIHKTRAFGINILDASRVGVVYGCGSVSGRKEPDKFGRFGLTRQAASKMKAPLVAEAVANLECKVVRELTINESSLVIAKVVEAMADPRHFVAGRWSFANGLRLLHHLDGSSFCVSDRMLSARKTAPN